MKYNRHYKAPKATGKRAKRNPAKKTAKKNGTRKGQERKTARRAYEGLKGKKPTAKKSKGKTMSKDDALASMGEEFIYFSDMTVDKRKSKSKPGRLVGLAEPIVLEDEPITFELLDESKANPKGRGAKSQEDIELENTKAIIKGLADETDQLLTRVAVQNVGGQVVMPFPKTPELAYVMGLYQGIESVKKICPTYNIPGISLINKDAANILATIEARKSAQRDQILEMARMERDGDGFGEFEFTETMLDISPSKSARDSLSYQSDNIPYNPALAWQFGYNIGMRYGLEACPLKWVPFVPAFRRIRNKLKQFDQRLLLEQARQTEKIQAAAEAQRQLEGGLLAEQARAGRSRRGGRR